LAQRNSVELEVEIVKVGDRVTRGAHLAKLLNISIQLL
jgi:hypothetical protein